MKRALSLVFPIVLFAPLVACGGGGGSTDNLPPCPTGDCGQASFRRAVPTSARLKIAKPTGQHKPGVANLEPVSPALVDVTAEVDDIDGMIDAVFSDLDDSTQTTPEIESDAEHQWRLELVDQPGLDEVVRITTDDGVNFAIEDSIGAAGFEPGEVAPILHGDVVVDGDEAHDFALTVDLDAYSAATGDVAQGEIVLAVMPLDGGDDEIWFDFHGVSFDGDPTEDSRTTAWIWDQDAGSVGLEYVADIEDSQATVYARWDAGGGRYDHHVAWTDPTAGPLDEIETNCWTESGAETFAAHAEIDSTGAYYGELDGEEDSCEFGPVADHPSPGDDFDDLPGEGEWSTLELGSICDLIPCQ